MGGQHGAFSCKCVDGRGLNFAAAVETDVSVAEVIDDEDDDVGLGGSGFGGDELVAVAETKSCEDEQSQSEAGCHGWS